jgi:SAM-dependent methyltransferase
MMDEIKCPVCQSDHSKQLFRIGTDKAGLLLIPDNPEQSMLISNEIASLWQSNQGEFRQCTRCRYGFAWPFIAGNEKIYSALYYKDFSYPASKWEYDRALQIIRMLNVSSETTMLELGAGNGTFLDKASAFIKDKGRIFSTEYSGAGREEIQRKGYTCFNSSMAELPGKNLPAFDVICMFQVLEHMDDLVMVFGTLNELGKKDAHLIIAVPNGSLRRFYDKWGVHLDVPPVHVGRFTPETFYYIGKKHHWNVLEITTEPQSYVFKVKKFVFDRYARLAFSRRTERSSNKLVKYFFRYLLVLLLTVRHLPVLIYLSKRNSGTSLLVHFQHQNGPQ